ncbi:MAG: VWA domain-containing protein [Phycisphaerae bacterium]|nr:VWA domain-containing protein [Phycisphaerae bacterium]
MADPFRARAGGFPEFESYPDSYVADPEDPSGGGGPIAPNVETAVVFVIDSSDSMSPRVGPSYFDLARDALVRFLGRPHIPADGTLMIGIVQNAPVNAADHFPLVDFFPLHVSDEEWRATVRSLLARMEPTQHASAGLLESGIHRAYKWLALLDPGVDRHIVLLTTGEYRFPCSFTTISPGDDDVPYTCPPVEYVREFDDADEDWDAIVGNCSGFGGPQHPCTFDASLTCNCNRACAIRYQAWKARQAGMTVSAVRLGPDWDRSDPDNDLANCPGAAGEESSCDAEQAVPLPYRDHLLRQLVNQSFQNGTWVETQACDGTPIGKYARLNPFFCPYCYEEKKPVGSPEILDQILAGWLCEWLLPEGICDEFNPVSGDEDCDGIHDVCDICYQWQTPDGRDCNRDGVGDFCQLAGGTDEDGDGLPDDLDECAGGDDCLIAEWREIAGCGIRGLPDRPECNCDCDNNGIDDLCSAAQQITDLSTCDESNPDRPDVCDGIPDVCNARAQVGEDDDTLYLEDFSTAGPQNPDEWQLTDDDGSGNLIDQSQVDPFDRKAWWLYPADKPSTRKHARLVQDPNDQGIVLELSQDTTQATNGSYRWFVEGPGIRLPEETMCEWTANECESSSCGKVDPGEWGVISVDFELYIDNSLGGTTYDLYIMEPCVQDEEFAKRAHLRFEDDPADPDAGIIYFEQFAYGGWQFEDAGFANTGLTYPENEWFRLRLVFDRSLHYAVSEEICCGTQRLARWTSPYAADAVALHVFSSLDDTVPASRFFSELGPPRKNVNRGVQVRLESNNQSCDCSQYGRDTSGYDHILHTVDGFSLPNLTDDRIAAQLRGEICGNWSDGQFDCIGQFDPFTEESTIQECWVDADPLVRTWLREHCANWKLPDFVEHEQVCYPGAPDEHDISCDIPDCEDNCPGIRNPWQRDSDLDGWGDACDGYWGKWDKDPSQTQFDGVWGMFDNCPGHYNPARPYRTGSVECADNYWGLPDGYMWQPDSDCDGIGDECDQPSGNGGCLESCCGPSGLNLEHFSFFCSGFADIPFARMAGGLTHEALFDGPAGAGGGGV